MKRIFILLVITSFIVAGCNSNNTTKNKDKVNFDGHNARTALEYKGEYRGVTPCADCPGIETTLILNDDDYVLKTKYMDRGDNVYEEKGKFRWKNGSTIVLENASSSYQFFVGENWVKQLDMNGNEITGDHADLYILKKK